MDINEHVEPNQYRYGDKKYNIEEISRKLYRTQDEKRPYVLNCLNQYCLADILERGGMPIVAKKIRTIADSSYKLNESKYTQKIHDKAEKKYNSKIKSATGLGGKLKQKHYKSISLGDTERFLDELLSGTFGFNNYPVSVANELGEVVKLVDLCELSQEECEAVAKNYKRFMWSKEMQIYEKDKSK